MSPTAAAHAQKALHNAACYAAKFAREATYTDWAAVVLFYRALHAVDSYLAEQVAAGRLSTMPDGHATRFRYVRQHMKRVADPYRRLFDLSHEARYRCISIPRARIVKAEAEVTAVERGIDALRAAATP